MRDKKGNLIKVGELMDVREVSDYLALGWKQADFHKEYRRRLYENKLLNVGKVVSLCGLVLTLGILL